MGWFDEQIRERKQYDDEAFSEAFANMASAVMGKRISAAVSDDRRAAKDAIDDILKHYHIKSREIPDSISDVNEQLEYLLRPYGIMRRTVRLEDGWYRDAIGAMLGFFRESGKAVALIPGGLSGYTYFDPETGRRKRIDRKNQHLFGEEAIVFYKPFPLKKLSLSALAGYIVRTLSASDYVMIALATLALSLLGMLSPMISQMLFARVLPSGSVRLLAAMAVFSVCVSVSVLLVTAVKDMIQARIETNVFPCHQMSGYYEQHGDILGNAKRNALAQLLSRGPYLNEVCTTLGTLREKNETCGKCPHFEYCNGGCRAVALALTGDKLGVDPSKCLFWSRDYDRRIAERLPGYDNGTPVLSRTF